MKPNEAESSASIRNIYGSSIDDVQVKNNNSSNKYGDDFVDNGLIFARGTAIQDFYAGQKIFITGGTGFLGKLLIEKLLRSCPNVSTIYMLIRIKKGKAIEDRMEELFNNPVYDQLKEVLPKFRHKIVGISGDCRLPGLGLSPADRECILREVSIVFHGAATVKFDEKLTTALTINTGSTRDILELCHRMVKLKAIIHVSTIYANCLLPVIDEKFYPPAANYEDLVSSLEGLSDPEIKNLTPKIIGKWPNTYSFTKALAEAAVRERCKGLCVGVFRPAIVVSCAREPKPGWTDNIYGPTAPAIATAKGILKTVQVDPKCKANVVPVDFTVNALLASAWDVANQPDRKDGNVLIYNYGSAEEKPITWLEFCSLVVHYSKEFPLSTAHGTVGLNYPSTRMMSVLSRMFCDYPPAIIYDLYHMCLGNQPTGLATYKKVDYLMEVLRFFFLNNWEYGKVNVAAMWQRLSEKDQNIFPFDIKVLDWNDYTRDYMKGVRVYLLKDDLSTLEASKKLARRHIWMHRALNAGLLAILVLIIWLIVFAIRF